MKVTPKTITPANVLALRESIRNGTPETSDPALFAACTNTLASFKEAEWNPDVWSNRGAALARDRCVEAFNRDRPAARLFSPELSIRLAMDVLDAVKRLAPDDETGGRIVSAATSALVEALGWIIVRSTEAANQEAVLEILVEHLRDVTKRFGSVREGAGADLSMVFGDSSIDLPTSV